MWTSFTIDREKEEFTSLLAGKSKLLKIILQSFCVFVRGSVPKSFLNGPLKLSNYKLSLLSCKVFCICLFFANLQKLRFVDFFCLFKGSEPTSFICGPPKLFYNLSVVLLGFFCGPLLLFRVFQRHQNVTQMIK